MSRRVKVNVGLRNIKVPELITYASTVYKNVLASPILNSPLIDLPAFDVAVKKLRESTKKAWMGSSLDVARRNEDVVVVKRMMRRIGHHIEDVANDPIYEENPSPETIIVSTGMKVKNFSPRQIQRFGVKHGLVPGVVILTATGIKGRGTHLWEYTLNPEDEKSWIAVDPTVQAITSISNLESGRRYYFRHCTVQKEGRDNWEAGVSIIVM